MPLAAIYCRVSTGDQREHGFSLPTQVDHCTRYAQANGYEVPEAYRFEEDHTGPP
jgi:DNA invertase Pin-like site-specific DNA recombinase